ncbi:MAG: Nif3-like dinuclear metal center hexameric protein [Thermodesulfobacteriota bacterium]
MTKSRPVLKDLLTILDGIAAASLAESWDNVGLMVGDPGQEISGVLVALDVSEAIMAEAEGHGCNVVVSHHPFIFKPLAAIRTDQVTGRLLARALARQMAVVSCHTNLDKVPGGVNDVLASSLDLQNCRVLAADSGGVDEIGLGRLGELRSVATFPEFIDILLAALDLPAVRVAGVVPEQLSTIAVCGGSGSELAGAAMAAGAQVFITGEVKHSTARWAEDAGFCVIDAGHFSTEKLVVPSLVSAIAKGFGDRDLAVNIRTTEGQSSPFQYYFRK